MHDARMQAVLMPGDPWGEQVVDVNRSNKGTRSGGIATFSAMVVIGNFAVRHHAWSWHAGFFGNKQRLTGQALPCAGRAGRGRGQERGAA